MKKLVLLAMIVFTQVSCHNTGLAVTKADSLKIGLDSTVDKMGDSAKAKGARALGTSKDKPEDLTNKAGTLKRDSAK